MKYYRIVYTKRAVSDLTEIYDYLAHELAVPRTAEKLINRIREAIEMLDSMPMRYQTLLGQINIRRMPIEKFVVIYEVNSQQNEVSVLRVVYGGRNLNELVLH